MEKYIITEATLVLVSLGNKTRIIEKYQEIIINKSIQDIVNESCLYYGSSLRGRCDSTYFLIGVKYKCPIVICEKKNLFFFPTTSFKNKDCIWFNYLGIKKYFLDKNKILNIILSNEKKVFLNISNNIISNQIFKTSRLESVLRKIS